MERELVVIMSDDRLKEIFDSTSLQMIAEQNVGYRNKYSPILTEKIDLYNAVIKYKEVINKAINYINNNIVGIDVKSDNIMLNRTELLDILKGVEDK